jgi:hypothetical protein
MEEITVKQAVERLTKELEKDKSEGSYYYGWQSSIAMSIYDEFIRKSDEHPYIDIGNMDIAEICNEGAKNFLNILLYDDAK